MSLHNKHTFKLSCLAAAVLSLSACSSTPTIPGVDLDSIGNGLSKAGSKTMELGSSAWEGTKDLLNIGPDQDDLLDEVDLALMEADADPNGLNVEGIQVASASDDIQLLPQDGAVAESVINENDSLLPEAESDNKQLAFGQVPEDVQNDDQLLADNGNTNTLLEDEMTLADARPLQPSGDAVVMQDLTHEVSESETLWDIAKSTTGDANNWHVIADINNLAPDASVYVGQKLTIPADMVKPGYGESAVAVEEPASDQLLNEQDATVALNIPKKDDNLNDTTVVAATDEIKPGNAEDIMTNATALQVESGETLWDFAKRTTGDALNWKTIASKNLFGDAQIASIRPGQKIYVPTDLVRYRDANGVLIAKGEEGNVDGAAIGVMPKSQDAIEASAAVLAGTNTPEAPAADAATGDIKIVEAAYQDDTGVKPVTAESLSEEVAEATEADMSKLGKVMVSGTYYPKAVYNEADFSSSLLMRVSPGTQLLVSKAIGPWLEVQTDKGVGYVHSRDIK